MSQISSVESSTQSNQAGALHPVLKNALNHLHIQLDEELNRYRRHKRLATNPAPAASRYKTAKPPDLITIQASNQPATSSLQQPGTGQSRSLDLPQPRSASSPGSIAPEQSAAGMAHPGSIQAENSVAALVLASSTLKPETVSHPASEPPSHLVPMPAITADPYDYLASSEALLESLSEEEGQVTAPHRNLFGSAPASLVVGAVLLVLLSSATLGFVVINQLNASKPQSTSEESTAADPRFPSRSGAAEKAPVLPPTTPDLTVKEFPDLNLSTLGTLPNKRQSVLLNPSAAIKLTPPQATVNKPSTGQPAKTQPATTSVGQTPIVPITVPPRPTRVATPKVADWAPAPAVRAQPYVAPRSQPVAPPAQTYTPPVVSAPQPAASPSAPPARADEPTASTGPSPTKQDYYYVISDYDSDRTLQKAQQSVPGAYVRNLPEGARIQMGAFSSPEKARALAEQMQQQGIPAQVYQK